MTVDATIAREAVKSATGREPWELTLGEFTDVIDPRNGRWRAGYRDDRTHRDLVLHGLIHAPDSIPDSVLREYAKSEPAALNELQSRR